MTESSVSEKIKFGPFDPASFKRIMETLKRSGIQPEIEENPEELKAQEKSYLHDPLAAYQTKSYAPAYLYVFLTEQEVQALNGKLSGFGVFIGDSQQPESSENNDASSCPRCGKDLLAGACPEHGRLRNKSNPFPAVGIVLLGAALLLAWLFAHK